MSISNVSDFKVYNEEMQAGYIETATQVSNAFNAASNGAISMTVQSRLGAYEKEAFFKEIAAATLITRQDITSNSAATPLKLSQDENVRVKVHRKIGPVDSTFKAFNMIGEDAQRAFSFQLGQAIAKAQPVEMLNTGLLAARAAIANNSSVTNDVTAATSTSCTHANLIKTLAKFGDAYSSLRAWVMHSQNFFDLGLDAVANSVDSVVANVLQVFQIPSIGVPVIVTDSASLLVSTNYHVLGLTESGLQLVDSEATNVLTDIVTGNEQLQMRIQGEMAYNVGVKGYQWDVANGGANPDATSLGTGSNWDKVATDNKSTAGIVLKCLAAA